MEAPLQLADVDVWVGTTTGTLKGLFLSERSAEWDRRDAMQITVVPTCPCEGASTKKNGCVLYSLPQQAQEDGPLSHDRSKEILVMCWDSAAEDKVSWRTCAICLITA